MSGFFKNDFRRDVKEKLTDAELIQGNYNELIAGIAPSSAVVLWISGVNDTKEIEIYKADEISPDLIKDYDIVDKDQRTKNKSFK